MTEPRQAFVAATVSGFMAVLNSWAVYKFPRLCPNFPLAEAERARRHDATSRVFFKGAIILLGRPVKRWPAASALTRCRSSWQPPRPPRVDGSAAVRELVNRDHWSRGKNAA